MRSSDRTGGGPLAVSVVVPTYGPAPYLVDTLLSLDQQRFRPEEVVVIDDGSVPPVTVPTTALGTRVIRIGHGGIAAARNAGIRATTAPLVHICDHDDALEPQFYETIVDVFASQPSIDVVHAACGFIDAGGAPTPGLLPGSRPEYGTSRESLQTLLSVNPIASVATVFRREVAERLHGFRSLDFVQDWDFWIRAAVEQAKFAFVPDLLAWHRVHAEQQSAPERAPLIFAEARRMLRSQPLPRQHWVARERKIADLHLEEAAHHSKVMERRFIAFADLALAAPVRPLASLRALAGIWK